MINLGKLMKIQWGVSLLIALFFCFTSYALEQEEQGEEISKTNTTYTISYISHPGINLFIPLVKQAYKNLGFDTEFIAMPGFRGAIALNNGLVDADLLRTQATIDANPNIMKVNVSFPNIIISLLCLKGIPCSQDILHDPNQVIISNTAVQRLVKEFDVKAKLVNIESNQSIIDMMKVERVSYALFGGTPTFFEEYASELSVINLKNIYVYHVVNRKHADLIPLLEIELASLLAEK